MKGSASIIVALILLLCVPAIISARSLSRPHSRHGHHHPTLAKTIVGSSLGKPNVNWKTRPTKFVRGPDTLQIAGSRLPDCSHACGSCSPCRLVMVSFVCASLQEAETCPMAYKCMCRNKSYPVP
ncbi:Epidermal patterning factor 1 [Quillaja saponaria]|uniref:Epidermal patterning factor-like protein n=1 Tax=Quillaja saponaria TaxID=32244 RepID=A0AAD7PB17_QUISA|nr:Epidermal patterning factor 1 [Quillaja saponaria]